MSILIDPPSWHAHGRRWSHLVSDASPEELHAFAAALGIPRRAFEGDHYDVPSDLHARAVALGAEPVGTRELLLRLRASGLRRPKRRGEKVLSSTGPGPGQHDVVLSRALPHPHGVHRVVLLDPAGTAVRTVPSTSGPQLPACGEAPPGARVLGFRRTWHLRAGRRHVLHEGVLLTSAPGTPGPVDGTWTPLAQLPPRWWTPLLRAAGLLPPG